ncbi:hypothetical protein K4R64_01315 [Staphylococcus epidermidis]|nr:hypothetical protein [Staphylococcus epidermidis]
MISDIFEYIEKVLNSNAIVNEHVGNRIFFYQVEETDEESINLPFIVINSLDPYSPCSFASNNYFNQNFVVQIDVESKDDSITKLVANEITKELFKHYLFKLDGGLDEFFIETQRFVDSRRYEGIPKNIN